MLVYQRVLPPTRKQNFHTPKPNPQKKHPARQDCVPWDLMVWKLWKLNADLVGSPEGGTDWEVWGEWGAPKTAVVGRSQISKVAVGTPPFFWGEKFSVLSWKVHESQRDASYWGLDTPVPMKKVKIPTLDIFRNLLCTNWDRFTRRNLVKDHPIFIISTGCATDGICLHSRDPTSFASA